MEQQKITDDIEEDIMTQFRKVSAELVKKNIDLGDLKVKQMNLQAALDIKKYAYIEEANDAKDPIDGKQRYKNQELRDAYVFRMMSTLDGTKEKHTTDEQATKLTYDIEGLTFKFKCLKTIIDYNSSENYAKGA